MLILPDSMKKDSKISLIRFKYLEKDLFPKIAELHIGNIPTGFISSLGLDFVTTVYRTIEKDQQSFGFVAMEGDKILGFISFSNNLRGLYRVAALEMGTKFGRVLLKKLFSFRTIKKIMDDVFYPFKAEKLNLPKAELLSIVVVPEGKGKGIAGRLVEAGLNLCKTRGIDRVKVLVAAENEPANKLYQKYGFEFRTKTDSHGIRSNIYVVDLNKKPETNNQDVDMLPHVTVIVPCRNEEKFIGKCLDSFLCQMGSKKDCEILCVDGISTDRTAEIIKEYSVRDNRVKLITNVAKITPVAMNLALKQAQGDFIVVVSCHAEYASDYIDKCLEVIHRTGADQVGGYIITCPSENTATGVAIAAATSCLFGVGNSKFRLSGPEQEVDTVPFGMYRREVFKKIGLYDERMVRNQDIELNSRIRKSGGRIIISPEIKATYYSRATYRGIWQQSFSNGLWNPYTIWLAIGSLSLRHFVPLVFVLSPLLLFVGSLLPLGIIFDILFLAVLLSYGIAALYFSFRLSREKRLPIRYILWSFIVLHIAYGLGSLWGILTFLIKFPNPKNRKTGRPLADRKT